MTLASAPAARRPSPIAWQIATVTAIRAETPTVRSFTLGAAGVGRSSGRPARRPAADRRGRLQRRAELLDRVRAGADRRGSTSPSRRSRAARCRRSCTRWWSSATGWRCAARSAATSSGRRWRCGGTAAPGRGRLRRRAADGDAPAPRQRPVAQPGAAALLVAHWEEVIYRDELDALAAAGDGLEVVHTLTRSQPAGWMGYDRRIDDRMIAEVLEPLGAGARCFVCGPTALVEVAANALVRAGPPGRPGPDRAVRPDGHMSEESADRWTTRPFSTATRWPECLAVGVRRRDDRGPRPVRPLPQRQSHGRASRLHARAGDRAALSDVLGRGPAHRRDAGRDARRRERHRLAPVRARLTPAQSEPRRRHGRRPTLASSALASRSWRPDVQSPIGSGVKSSSVSYSSRAIARIASVRSIPASASGAFRIA